MAKGRPRTSGDRFSVEDLGVAANVTKRAAQHLLDTGLLPEGNGIRALKRAATAGAFMGGGVSLVMAGRLAAAIPGEFNEPDGEAPSGFRYLARALTRRQKAALPAEPSDYWYHAALYATDDPVIYPRNCALPNDAVAEIVDRKLVFVRSVTSEPQLVGSLELARGEEARLIHVSTQLDGDDPEFDRKLHRLQEEARTLRAHAVAVLTVNLSLAIRAGLDRLAEHRAALSSVAA